MVSHLCGVSQKGPDPSLGLIFPPTSGVSGSREGKEEVSGNRRQVVAPVVGGHLGWRDSLLSEGRS